MASAQVSLIPSPATPAFLRGGGGMGERIRAKDWCQTPVGPPETWRQSLRMAVSTCLGSSFPIVIWWGRDLTLIYNDPYTAILGNKHPRALGQKGEECWREVWPLVGPMLERVLDQGTPFTADDLQLMVWRHGYFEECFFFSYSPIYEEDGSVSGVFCPVIESTDKIIGARRLETLRELAALRRAETLEGACQQAIAVLARNGRDVPFAYLYLLSEDGNSAALMGATDGSADSAEFSVAQVATWPLAGALDGVLVLDDLAGKHLPTGGWSEPPTQAYLAPVAVPGRQRARAILVAGVSPHKRLDQSYRSFLELLVAQVCSTIADTLAYEAERKRAEALAELDRAKTAFFSNISHEFRTPLALMLGPLESALSRSRMPEAARGELQIAHRNALRLLKLVNSLLDFSRIEAGRMQASYVPTDLAMLTTDLASSFRSACEAAGLRLAVDCPPLDQPVYVDREMWEKIVLNLLSNAFKFTMQGEIGVQLRRQGGFAALVVRDTGIGIAEAELPRIFERFHRVENAHGRTHEGSGIGLALVRELVGLNGGSIAVASVPEQGSTFAVRLPFGRAHLPADRIAAPRSLASTAARAEAFVEEALRWLPDVEPTGAVEAMFEPGPSLPAPEEGGRVLVVDDNADMRDYLRQVLAGRYEVELAADGQQALAAIARRRPDLVLSDIMMPRLDGFELVNALRAGPETRDLPIILLSARAGEEAKVEGLSTGADDYLIKPFSARELLARIATNLKMARVRLRADAAVRERERLRALVDGLPQLVWRAVGAGRSTWVSPQWTAYTGQSAAESCGHGWLQPVHAKDRDAIIAAWAETPVKGSFQVEHRLRHAATGSYRFVQSQAMPVRNEAGTIIEWLGTTTDIDDMRRRHEHQMMIAELQHRGRNLLAVVSSISDQTLLASESLDDYRDRFAARLSAVGRVQGLLSRQSAPAVTIEELVRMELTAHGLDRQQGGRIRLSGPVLVLAARAVQLLALALHELMTNALKHGSLAESGRLHITWSEQGGVEEQKGRYLRLEWVESGGRPIMSGAPTQRRFARPGPRRSGGSVLFPKDARLHAQISGFPDQR